MRLAFGVLALGAFGCSKADVADGTGGPLPGPPEWNKQVVPPSDDAATAARAACQYKAGALPAETQGASHPMGAAIPIDHIVVVMMENRSFDHYFQKLPEYGQKDAAVAPANFSNPDGAKVPVPIYHRTDAPPDKGPAYCFVDTSHGYVPSHQEANGGKMDGFVIANEGSHEQPVHGTPDMLSGARAMGYYDQTDLPFYYWLANEFAIGDHYHASVLGPTLPNRMYLLSSTSDGYAVNLPHDKKTDTVAEYVAEREVDWKLYASGLPSYAVFINKYIAEKDDHIRKIDAFYADVAAGTLPPLAYVEPQLAKGGHDSNDEHPPADAQLGQQFAAKVVDTIAKSPYWAHAVVFITYDEHGGLFDHVPPPKACAPDDLSVALDGGEKPTFANLGIRVPFIVVSPYAKKHFVGHHVYDHTSINRFIEARFVLPALTNRDANAEAPWEMFDFDNPPHAAPPVVTMPTVDAQRFADCEKVFKP